MWVLQPSLTTYTWLSAKLTTGVYVVGVVGVWVVEVEVEVLVEVAGVVGTVVVSVKGTTSTTSSVMETIKASLVGLL